MKEITRILLGIPFLIVKILLYGMVFALFIIIISLIIHFAGFFFSFMIAMGISYIIGYVITQILKQILNIRLFNGLALHILSAIIGFLVYMIVIYNLCYKDSGEFNIWNYINFIVVK